VLGRGGDRGSHAKCVKDARSGQIVEDCGSVASVRCAIFCLVFACKTAGQADAGVASPAEATAVDAGKAPPPAISTAAGPSSASSLQSETTQWLAAIAGYDAGTAVLSGDKAAPPFRKQTQIDEAELGRIVGAVPELARLGQELRLFTQGDALQISKKGREEPNGVVFSEKPILWAPEAGAEVLVLTGRSKSTGFVIALYPVHHEGAADTYRLASFLIMPGDLSPVVLAYRPERRRELFWTGCWDCSAEQGGVSYREDRRVVIVQH
jgi:hypothetical protein